ncbi:hypothetical protein KM043_010476 [Ampulex compressa]|nr:hypothetical protein KM043_010476 [Ampulex compressa]
MVFNRKDLAKAFSPNRTRKLPKKREANGIASKPSTSGSTTSSVQCEDGSRTNIKVIVRVRPHNERESQSNSKTILKVVDEKMLIFDPKQEEHPFFYQGVAQKGRDLLKKQNKELQFIFDTIFDIGSTNEDVFEGSTKELIQSLLEGYNCSVFAYGATGAGKTHTMLGSPHDPGITYRTVSELFSEIGKQSEHRRFNLGVTYLEIYNENVQDLLHKSGPLQLRDDGRCGVIVAGLRIIAIQSAEELLTLLARGNKNRTQHPTDANEESSRSHAVFQVYVNITTKLDGQVKQVKLSMIDLAGSERASATGCKGMRFKEGANINKSLLALGNCINNLADGSKHVTYRDSKLTRLLKDSLGGNCRTVMIANIAPSNLSYEDTYNTLRYADRAKKIKTRVKKNIISCEMHVTGYIKMVEEQKKEIDFLKQKLSSLESGAIQMSVDSKERKATEEKESRAVEIAGKLSELLYRKKRLNEKLLCLESTDKIMCCRIQYKRAADERLQNLTAAIDVQTEEEQNASGKLRVHKSLHYFKRQRESLRIQIEAAWAELRELELEIEALNGSIEEKECGRRVADIVSKENFEIERCRMQQQFEHAKKVCSLQQCEMRSLYTIIRMTSATLQNYYNTMTGYGAMTAKMKEEFKRLVKRLEGVRSIKWSDSEAVDREENFYSLTCLSVSQLMEPLGNEMPVYEGWEIEEEEGQEARLENILSRTYDAIEEETTAEGPAERVEARIAAAQKSVEGRTGFEGDRVEEEEGVGPRSAFENLNGTFSLREKPRKRALADKNELSNRTTIAKQPKRLSPKRKGFSVAGATGKENKDGYRARVVMNAKSIAILNKLKLERDRPPTIPRNDYESSEVSDQASLKATRDKERRGRLAAHPYQKPAVKDK